MTNYKFRMWDAHHKKMVYRELNDKNWYYTPKNDEDGCHLAYASHQRNAHCPIMLSTNYEDINGIEIYEGDILEIDNDGEKYITHVRKELGTLAIDVINQGYQYTAIGWIDDWCIIKIIGNIHEHKLEDLIK